MDAPVACRRLLPSVGVGRLPGALDPARLDGRVLEAGARGRTPRGRVRREGRRRRACRRASGSRPPTITVSTFLVSAWWTTVETGSMTGYVLEWSQRITTTSACLPGVSEPVRSSSPQTRAPSIVANSSTSRELRSSGSSSLPAANAASCSSSRAEAKRNRICVNMSPGTVVTTSIERLGRRPCASAFDGRRRAVSHRHLDRRRDRDLAARVRDETELVVGEVVAVDVRRVRPEQAEVVELRDHREAAGVGAHADMDADRRADLACQRPVVLHHLRLAEPGAARAHCEREEAVVAREVTLADAADVLGRGRARCRTTTRRATCSGCRSSRRRGGSRPGGPGSPRRHARACSRCATSRAAS